VNGPLLAEFIQSMNAAGELSRWTVAVVGGGTGRTIDVGNGSTLKTLQRRVASPASERYSIGRLLSPRDEAIDLTSHEWDAALELTRQAWRKDAARLKTTTQPDAPNGPAVRAVRGFGFPDHTPTASGLLLLYFLDPRTEWTNLSEGAPEVAAFGISFPGSNTGVKVEYKINNVLWEQEYGPAQ
jgi:hypothetical protein